MMKKSILVMLFFLPFVVKAFKQKSEILKKGDLSIKGYDVFAFHIESRTLKEADKFAHQSKDTRWLFSNQSNLEMLTEGPEDMPDHMETIVLLELQTGKKAPPRKSIHGRK